jgi:hypothetical protein
LTFTAYSDLIITKQTTKYLRYFEGELAAVRGQLALCQSSTGTIPTSDLLVVGGGRAHSREFGQYTRGGDDVATAGCGIADVAGRGDLVPSGSNLEASGDGWGEWIVIVSSADATEAVIEDVTKDGDAMRGGDAGCILGYDGNCTSNPAAIVDDGHHITVPA